MKISREQAEERLIANECGEHTIEHYLNILFPPPFIPKEGEVIAVSMNKDRFSFRKFQRISNNYYVCEHDMISGDDMVWEYARPLTDKEKGL